LFGFLIACPRFIWYYSRKQAAGAMQMANGEEKIGLAAQAYALKSADAFLPVVSSDKSGERVAYYGGDQAWFKTRVGRFSGCGAVAAADIFAYLALRSPDMKALFSGDLKEITVESFRNHMEETIQFVAPSKLPFVDVPYGGLTSLSKFTSRSEKFTASRGIKLKGQFHSADDLDFNAATERIGEQLALDNPVALLTMLNNKLKSIPYTDPFGKSAVTDLRYHWMVITALKREGDRVEIVVSSEGARVTVDFGDVWTSDAGSPMAWRGIVYFLQP
jgi:hypothetical protein